MSKFLRQDGRVKAGLLDRPGNEQCFLPICFLFLLSFFFCLVAGTTGAMAQRTSLDTTPQASASSNRSGILKVTPTQEEGFGRIVLDFAGRNLLPGHSIKQDNSIFVIRFDERMKSNAVTALSRVLGQYVSIARLDPDGMGLRIALKAGVRINTIEAGEKLFVDLLPPNWSGLPPSLPPEIVTELAQRAEEALRLARSLEQADQATRIQPKLDIHYGDHPTFSRFAFMWNIPFDSTFERQSDTVTLYFNHKTQVDLSEIRASLPRLVTDMRLDIEGGRSKFTIKVAKTAEVRAFREGNSYIVDISGDKQLFEMQGAEENIMRAISKPGDNSVVVAPGIDQPSDDGQPSGVGDPVASSKVEKELFLGPGPDGSSKPDASLFTDAQVTSPVAPQGADTPLGETMQDGAAATDGIPLPKKKPEEKEPASVPAALQPQSQAQPQPQSQSLQQPQSREQPDAVSSTVNSLERDLQPAQMGVAATPVDPVKTVVVSSTQEPETSAPAKGNAEQMTGPAQDLTAKSLLVEAKTFGRSVRMYFPFKNPTPSAVFRYNGVIWAVFDTVLQLDVREARQHLSTIADDLEVWRSGNTSVLRVPLKNSRLVTFTPEGYGWLMTIGDMVAEPTKPLHMVRTKISGGRPAMRVKFEGAGSVLELRDPGTGESLHVVTGLGPARGFVKGQRLVDFSALISAHGIALAEHIDDLQVVRDEDFVYISSSRGLNLSNSQTQPQKTDVSNLTKNDGKVRETFLDLGSFVAKTPVIFTRERQDLEQKVAKFDDVMAIQSQMSLSRLLVANGYAAEALGHLEIIEETAPEFARSRGFRTLFAAAELFAGRPDAAFRRLDHPEFADDPDASVWRGLAASRSGRWREAEDALELAATVKHDYSDQMQQLMLLDTIEIAVLDQQFGAASAALAEVNPTFLDKEGIARYYLLRGKVDVARDLPDEAADAFKSSRETGYLPVANEAWLQDIKLRRQEGEITEDKAIDELEGLTTIWRGDDVELGGLRTLAHLYVDKGEYRHAFETLHSAASSNPNSDITRVLQEEMNGVFSSLFLDGKVDELSAVKALSLYYDFRELTPVGRRGDEMVRRLADKLVEVDLLDRAEELLTHQVDNRLKGAARSQIAADLAMIYLLDSKPNKALDVLRRTRQSRLPLSLERQRRLVEAKALAELNKVSLALDLLTPLQGSDVDQLRADILWRAKRWQDAAEQIEMMLSERWSDTEALDEEEQTNILRAGIAYSLAEDELGLDRLRRKFAAKMAQTSVAGAFDVVTLPIDRGGQQFQAIAQEIAGINTMERFLKEYRARYINNNGTASDMNAGDAPPPPPPIDNPNNPQV